MAIHDYKTTVHEDRRIFVLVYDSKLYVSFCSLVFPSEDMARPYGILYLIKYQREMALPLYLKNDSRQIRLLQAGKLKLFMKHS